MAKENKTVKEDPYKKYIKGKWMHFPNYQCPKCPSFRTVTLKTFKQHMQTHEKPVKKAVKKSAARKAKIKAGGKK